LDFRDILWGVIFKTGGFMSADVFSIKKYTKNLEDEALELPDFFYECLDFFEEEGYQIFPCTAANENAHD
jgi:hypothetical protein